MLPAIGASASGRRKGCKPRKIRRLGGTCQARGRLYSAMAADPATPLTRRQFLGAGVGVAAMSLYGASSNTLEVSRRRLESPAAQNTVIRVALITDRDGPHNWSGHQELVGRATRFPPALLCIAGDAVDDRGDEPLVARYAGIQARLGKFATLGNW